MSATLTPSVGGEIVAGDTIKILDLARERDLHPSTCLRWILRGLPAPSGGRVKLEASRLGRAWVTSRAAFARFIDALAAIQSPQAAAIRSAPRRARASERAARELQKLGI